MKKFPMFFAVLAAALPVFTSCEENAGPEATYDISISLKYEGSAYGAEGITVALSVLNGGASYEAATNASGTASFCVPAGTYEASASFRTAENGNVLTFNGVNSSVVVTASGETSFDIALTASETNQIVIKELYIGGCPTDDGSDYYQYDKYVVLYNNSSESATLSNLCLGMATPYNSNGTNNYYEGGSLIYSDWIPAACAIWWFQQDVTIEPYSQIVVALNGAIDHTATYSNSVDLSNSAYYATYDPECGFTNANYYPAPSAAIPTDHYLQSYLYGRGNAWPLSNTSPAFFIFSTEGTTPEAFAQDPSNKYQYSSALTDAKVPVEWIIDGVEVFRSGYDNNQKRLLASVDAGSVTLTGRLGYSVYRNVDKEATEALFENEGLLVYNYAGGTDGSTDPSGIDAEASIAAGAHIVYKDTNNASNDFHQRARASLRR